MPAATDRLTNRPVCFDLSTSDDSPAELGYYPLAVGKGRPAAAGAPGVPGRSICGARDRRRRSGGRRRDHGSVHRRFPNS